ncbi:hypothetical protein ARMSODRAFT_1087487 [Armillaria solidipes]|uniref:Uncharacterized protein n=1 Tax=Armillaria solidipes TaxID=1076256 RepID=A0A2H3BH29_9AGAR|nr:hypothetical protein ARMSODRAFT_1087487 [Armillaria solidipes]
MIVVDGRYFMPSCVTNPFRRVTTASTMCKAILARDMIIRCSPCRRLLDLSGNIPFPRFIDATSLTPVSTSLSTVQVLPPTVMSTLNACLKVANIAEASGVPYVENVAKVAVHVFELLEQKGKNKKNAEELCQSIADTIVVIDTLVRMQGEQGTSCYIDICGEMETYLQRMAQDIKEFKLKHRGIKGIFCVDDFRDAIQSYRRRVDDLKTDF